MIDLTLIRHGETSWNVQGRFQGSSDIPLNDLGNQQAQALQPILANNVYDAVYSSDLSRVVQTAHHAIPTQKDSIILDERLREIHFGQWEGMTWDEIKRDFPKQLDIWRNDREQNVHGGEKLSQVVARLSAFLDDVRVNNADKHVLVFAHGGVNALMLSVLLGTDPKKWWQFRSANTAITRLNLHSDGVILLQYNDTYHLRVLDNS